MDGVNNCLDTLSEPLFPKSQNLSDNHMEKKCSYVRFYIINLVLF